MIFGIFVTNVSLFYQCIFNGKMWEFGGFGGVDVCFCGVRVSVIYIKLYVMKMGSSDLFDRGLLQGRLSPGASMRLWPGIAV